MNPYFSENAFSARKTGLNSFILNIVSMKNFQFVINFWKKNFFRNIINSISRKIEFKESKEFLI